MDQDSNQADDSTPEKCDVVLVFQGPAIRGNMRRRAWCLVHDRFAEECVSDPFDTLDRLIREAEPEDRCCPRCGVNLDR